MARGETSVRFEWVDEGFQTIISSPEVNALVTGAAQRIATAAGDGFEVVPAKTTKLRYNRDIALVAARTRAAKVAEATEKRLSKAVQQCRIS